jgi:hypothetical protein
MNSRGAVPLKPGEKVTGAIPAVEVDLNTHTAGPVKLLPWQQSAYHGPTKAKFKPNPEVFSNTTVPQQMVDQMHAGLPPLIRRTPNQRYEALVQRLLVMGRQSVGALGYPVWPPSIQAVLTSYGIKEGDTDLHKQVYALAKHFIVRAENQQRSKDRKKVVLDWHGHYS